MALRLVIAEKPSVAQTIAAALGVKEKKDGYMLPDAFHRFLHLFIIQYLKRVSFELMQF